MTLSVTRLTPVFAARIDGDNRCVLHRATPFDATRHQRLMQRTTVSGDPGELAPSGVAVADGRFS